MAAQNASFAGAQSIVPLGGGVAPYGVAVDANGNVYVADVTNSQVVKAGWSNGAFSTSVVANAGSNGLSSPESVAVDASGNLYIADTGNNRVLKESLSGGTYTQSVVANQPTNGLNAPDGVALDASGNVYIADEANTRVLKETLSGGVYSQSVVASGLLGPRSVAVDTAGNVYIADVNGTATNSQVLKEKLSGGSYTQSTVANHAANGLSNPIGVGVDPGGNVYVGDAGLNEVLKETVSGGSYAQSVFANHAANGLSTIAGLAVDWSGGAYIADSGNADVLKVQAPAANFGMVPAGSTGWANQLTFTFSASETLNSTTPYQVLAMGATGQEYADAGADTCTAGSSFSAGRSCTVNVTFAPVYSGTRNGAVVLEDTNGNTIATALMSGVGTGPQMIHFGGFEVIAATHIGQASDVTVDSAGNVYIVDEGGGYYDSPPDVYKITPSTNIKLPLGSGWELPIGLALDGAGDVYVSDYDQAAVFKITPGGTQTKLSITVKGPIGLAVDFAGNLFVADASGPAVYKMTPGGTVTSLGSGWDSPNRLAVDSAGNLYVSDYGNGTISKITPAGVKSIVSESIGSPFGVAVDPSGTIYVASGAGSVDQTVYELTQTGTATALVTQTDSAYPQGVALDTSGNLYIADSNQELALPSSLIYELDRVDALPTIVFPTATPVNTLDTTDGAQTVTFQNIGNDPLIFATPGSGSNPDYPASFPENTSDANLCTSTMPLGMGAACDVSMEFEPAASGAISDSIVLTDNSLNVTDATQSVAVSGTGIGASQTINFPQPASPVVFGVAPITLSATATSGLAVTFSVIGGPGSVSGNVLTVTGAGTITIAANQAGNAEYNAAAQVTRSIAVNQATPSITWAQPAPIPYGTALSSTQLDASASVPGTFVYTPPAGTVLSAGSQTLAVAFTPNDTTDYTNANYQVSITVDQAAALTAPTAGSTLSGANVTFTWTAGGGATAYELWLGTTGVNSSNVYNSGSITTTSISVTVPSNGVYLYAVLWSMINGAWQPANYVFTESGSPSPATMSSPTPGTALPGSNVTFSWLAGGGVTQYQLWLSDVGYGRSDMYNSGALTTTSVNLNGLPAYGVKVYATLWSRIDGNWQAEDYSYMEAGTPVPATLTAPAPGSTLTGSSATFTWSAGGGVTEYELWIGTTGAGSLNIYNSNNVTAASANLTGLPTNGVLLYVTLWSRINNAWQAQYYTLTEAGTPVLASLSSPSPGSMLTGASATFTWNPGAGPTEYELWLGTTVGASNLYTTNTVTTTSANVTGIPTNGVLLYVTLWSRVSGNWQAAYYTVTEAGSPVLAALTAPSTSSPLPGSSAAFTWSAGAGPTAYELWLGTTGAGSSNVYNSGSLGLNSLSLNVSGIPANGVNLYVTLWSRISGNWEPAYYTFTEAGTPAPAAMISPAPGTQLSGANVTFTWSTGSGPTQYELWLGTSANSSNLYNSGAITAASVNITGLPTSGATIYATLWSRINGNWQSIAYTYTEQ